MTRVRALAFASSVVVVCGNPHVTNEPDPPFSSLGLAPQLLTAIDALGWAAMTPVQAAAIPVALSRRDALVEAATGSGKTAAFVLPILQALSGAPRSRPRALFALVLVPTRELAAQIGEAIHQLGRHLADRPKTVVVFGGCSENPQMMALRGGADILVATPGRLLDLVAKNAVSLSSVATLVLDEADRMLSLGFADELARVLALLPPNRQSLLFSATLPDAVHAVAARTLRDAVAISAVPAAAWPPSIAQRAVELDAAKRVPALRRLLEEPAWSRVLVFVATRYAADHLARKLCRAGIAAAGFHGDASQGLRTQTLEAFRTGAVRVLVATDVAGRGLDVPGLSCVVNFDLPRSPSDYVHRIGRTGRAGAPGVAISFIGERDEAHFRLIERTTKQPIARERLPGFDPVERRDDASAPGVGGVKGARKSKKDRLREAAAAAARASSGG